MDVLTRWHVLVRKTAQQKVPGEYSIIGAVKKLQNLKNSKIIPRKIRVDFLYFAGNLQLLRGADLAKRAFFYSPFDVLFGTQSHHGILLCGVAGGDDTGKDGQQDADAY